MRHGISGYKLSRSSSHRKSMLNNLMKSIITHAQIKTTLQKAKFLRPHIEKLITLGKRYDSDSVNTKRLLMSTLQDITLVDKVIEFGARYKDRNGGYSRIIKLGFRSGDKADIAIIQLI